MGLFLGSLAILLVAFFTRDYWWLGGIIGILLGYGFWLYLASVQNLMIEWVVQTLIAQWEKIKNAQGLAFIAPTFWLHFPAILKGWFERVFSYGDAYALTPVGWQGDSSGRVPLLHHEKALVISTTLFREEDYKAAWELPMKRIIDDWGLRYPGVKKVEHVYFYRVSATDDETRRSYLEQAYKLGRDYSAF